MKMSLIYKVWMILDDQERIDSDMDMVYPVSEQPIGQIMVGIIKRSLRIIFLVRVFEKCIRNTCFLRKLSYNSYN